MSDLHLLSDLCVAGATLGILYNVFAAILLLRFSLPKRSQPREAKPVTILKPLHGDEPGLFPRLTSFCTQDYPGKIQLVCGTQQATDQAVHAVRLLQRMNPNSQIDLVIDERSRGTNRKMANLVNMEGKARHDIVVLSDSDIVVDRQFVSGIAAEFENAKTGAVTCLYYGIASAGLWSRVSALNINSQFLPNVIMALTFGAARPCFGSAIAMRRDTLKRIGGLGAFVDELADDYAIGKAVRSTGMDVVVSRWTVGHACFERSFRAFWEHHMRSARTIRAIDPIGYVGLVFMHPVMLSLLAALAGGHHPVALTAVAFAARGLVSTSVERCFRLPRQTLWLLPLHDAISFAVFLCSFFGTAVEWRGYSYRILRDGTIERSN